MAQKTTKNEEEEKKENHFRLPTGAVAELVLLSPPKKAPDAEQAGRGGRGWGGRPFQLPLAEINLNRVDIHRLLSTFQGKTPKQKHLIPFGLGGKVCNGGL